MTADQIGLIIMLSIMTLSATSIFGLAQAETDFAHWHRRTIEYANPWGFPWPHRPLQYAWRFLNPGYLLALLFVRIGIVLSRINDVLKLW